MGLLLPRSVYIHVPKTGGTTIRRLLREMGLDCGETNEGLELADSHHAFYEVMKDEVEGLKVFSSVRKTLPWYRSLWCHIMRTGENQPVTGEQKDHRQVFSDWIRHVTKFGPGHYGTKLANAFSGCEPILIETDVDLFGGLKTVLEQVGEEFTWPFLDDSDVLNASSEEEKEEACWTADLIELVEASEGPGGYPDLFMREYGDCFVRRETGITV